MDWFDDFLKNFFYQQHNQGQPGANVAQEADIKDIATQK